MGGEEGNATKGVMVVVAQQLIGWLLPAALARRITLSKLDREGPGRGFAVIVKSESGQGAV